MTIHDVGSKPFCMILLHNLRNLRINGHLFCAVFPAAGGEDHHFIGVASDIRLKTSCGKKQISSTVGRIFFAKNSQKVLKLLKSYVIIIL